MHTYLQRCFATLGATGTETMLQMGIRLHNTVMVLHHNHKMSICYHKIGLVSSHQFVGRWLIFMRFVVRIF